MIRISPTVMILSNGALVICDAMYNHIGNGHGTGGWTSDGVCMRCS